jgi:multidrug transporter EmrE-like cation transporter
MWKIGNFDMLPLAFGVWMALIDIAMMSCVKLVDQGRLSYMIGMPVATLLYAMEPYVFLKAMTYSNMTIVNLIWNMTSNVIVTLSGVLIFGEKIQGIKWIAVGIALFSLGLFAYSES